MSDCSCVRCLMDAGVDIWWMVPCGECGNKRCAHADNHRQECVALSVA